MWRRSGPHSPTWCAPGPTRRTCGPRSPVSEATMRLNTIDWIVLALYGIVCVAIGLAGMRPAGQGRQEVFLSGRRLPWWLLGVSLLATTFSTDTPDPIPALAPPGGNSHDRVWCAF